ncbi:MAG: hypothetical protein IJO56_05840 [Oscillospiraceae bacterium]|nr:hypothetical protein [Oscillospiraceae bacterium]
MATEKRLIDADELIDRLNHTTVVAYPNLFPGLLAAAEIVDDSPTVDAVEVVHGRWVGSGQWNHKPYRMRNKEKWQTYLCSECGRSNGRRFNDNYCPNCGAKMDGENKIY